MKTPPTRGKTPLGFSLIEVMIALVILSLGLLGLAGTLLTVVRSADSSYAKQQAVTYAYDILDRMRANALAATSGTGSANPYNTALTSTAGSTPSANCTTTACTATDMAAYDVWQWKTLLQTNLPGGQGAVTVAPWTSGCSNSATCATITVTVQWIDAPAQAAFAGAGSAPASAATTSYTLTTALSAQ